MRENRVASTISIVSDGNDALCFVRLVVDRIPTPMLDECIKVIGQGGVDCEWILLRALLKLYQDMPVEIPTKESNDLESYRKHE